MGGGQGNQVSSGVKCTPDQQISVSAAYLTVELLHGHEVQGLEGMPCRGDEIEADVDPGVVVVEQRALDLQLLLEVVLKLSVDVVHNGFVAVDSGRRFQA